MTDLRDRVLYRTVMIMPLLGLVLLSLGLAKALEGCVGLVEVITGKSRDEER